MQDSDLLSEHCRAVFGQAVPQLCKPAHEADDCSPHSEGMHAKLHTAAVATAVHSQPEVALPTRCLENLQPQLCFRHSHCHAQSIKVLVAIVEREMHNLHKAGVGIAVYALHSIELI